VQVRRTPQNPLSGKSPQAPSSKSQRDFHICCSGSCPDPWGTWGREISPQSGPLVETSSELRLPGGRDRRRFDHLMLSGRFCTSLSLGVGPRNAVKRPGPVGGTGFSVVCGWPALFHPASRSYGYATGGTLHNPNYLTLPRCSFRCVRVAGSGRRFSSGLRPDFKVQMNAPSAAQLGHPSRSVRRASLKWSQSGQADSGPGHSGGRPKNSAGATEGSW
jgi:hypothetical protein